MSEIIIEPHYLGSLEYFTRLLEAKTIRFEIHQHFTKQTFKNRCVFLTSNGENSLTVPVKFGNRTPYKDVAIDYDQGWLRAHWGCFLSSYGKSPFFEFFADQFEKLWFKKHTFLLDLNIEMMTLCLQLLQIDRTIEVTKCFEYDSKHSLVDLRELITAKSSYKDREYYLPTPYTQVFGNKFAPNLSIIDLIMNEGSNALEILRKSAMSLE